MRRASASAFSCDSSESLLHARIYRDPVDFPRLAPVIRECLFKMDRIRLDVRNDKSNKNGFAIEKLLVEKLAASILELADRGLAQCTGVAIRKIEAPLVGFRIV